ncbi:MAG TPA: CPXCG motif-containing cysteine-rich protein [Candidatus Kapabacteria bacterium]|nr:CPXCG motif-containing cysteine-rich protein [Candidatus Kapabacteria bacterium]
MPFVSYLCAVCGEPNETFVDETNGMRQQYVEDCAVCCRPNVIRIVIDEETGDIAVENEFEG